MFEEKKKSSQKIKCQLSCMYLFNIKFTQQILFKEKESADFPELELIDSVKLEKENVLRNAHQDIPVNGIRVQGMSKIYRKYPFGIRSIDDKTALSDIFLEISDNELVAVLGHNGAGKSTLIGVLTGLLSPSSGKAIICGYDIRTDMAQIRKMMGVCPQFDILWNELTAREHLEMYCKIKNIPSHLISSEIDKRMAEVLLLDKMNFRVGTLSGGQKRRVSLAIAAIGDPKLIFLDEPTTGMDPNTRRQIWNMIKEMRTNRSVILTTHAMEEADILSDRIIVVSDGKLRAIGTPLYLKNSIGNSYRLSLILSSCDPLEVQIAYSRIQKLLPSAKSLTCDSANIVVGISLKHLNEMKNFFDIIECDQLATLSEEDKNFKMSIKEWSISHATLEEVFMHLSKDSQQFEQPPQNLEQFEQPPPNLE